VSRVAEFAIWLRQLTLFAVKLTGQLVLPSLDAASAHATRYAFLAASVTVILVAWVAQCRFQPYALRYQNLVEQWLYWAITLLLVLACVYASIPIDAPGRVAIEALMLVVLLGSVVVGAAIAVLKHRSIRWDLDATRMNSLLATAGNEIDGLIRDRLKDGSIRLLSCAWLQSHDADVVLCGTHGPLIKRRQDLPELAFVSSNEATALLDSANRSILVLSYVSTKSLQPCSSHPRAAAQC
jgi:hypothetical protein